MPVPIPVPQSLVRPLPGVVFVRFRTPLAIPSFMPKKRTSRVYWRQTGNARRAYGDFRDLGGGRERLIAPGETQATTDPDVAAKLATDRVRELERAKRTHSLLDIRANWQLEGYVEHYMIGRAKAKSVTTTWLEGVYLRLQAAVEFFGADRSLDSIGVSDVEDWLFALRQRPGRRGGTLSEGSVKHYANALSAVYKRAQAEKVVPPGFNPVASLSDKPTPKREEAHFLSVPEVALLLESARTFRSKREDIAHPHAYPLLATLFLTGTRWSEATGLLASDVSFDRSTVTIAPNEFRRLKTKGSRRVVPLHPQLRAILQEYEARRPPSRLLFPVFVNGKEQMVRDFRWYLDNIAVRAGWRKGEIRTRVARHSYTAARLQTLEGGAPISPYTVAREMGWRSLDMIFEVYGHIGNVTERKPFVEYRVEQHREQLAERLERIRAG